MMKLHIFIYLYMVLNTSKYSFFWILLCCMFIFFSSCEKNKDQPLPQIMLTSPQELDAFIVGDSIPVIAQITHTMEIVSVKIALVNAEGIPVLVPKYIYPGSSSYVLDYEYPINNNLPSGNYSLLISAGDGSNTTKVYTQLMISGVGRFFEQTIAICQPNTLNTYVYGINADGDYENILNLDHGYIDSDISSDQRQLYILKPSPDILNAYDLDSLAEKDFSVNASPPYPEYHSVSYFQFPSLAYVPNANGEIRGYNNQGSPIFITLVNTDTIPIECYRHDNMMLAYCARRGGPERFIRQYYSGTGVYRAGLKININVVDIFSLDPDQTVVFGNDDNTARAYVYDITGNVFYGEISLPEGLISQLVEISSGRYLIGHENGIYLYNHSNASMSIWLQGVSVDVLVYDDLRQYVYYAVENEIFVHRFSDAALLQQVLLPYEVANLLIQYTN